MKLVNPMGRQADTLDTGANYAGILGNPPYCVCSGTEEISNSHWKGPDWCVCYCMVNENIYNANFYSAEA